MSHEARQSVWKSSPYKGSALIVHLALGDVANDLHDNELWATIDAIARKARLGRSAVSAALRTMVSDGYLEVLEEGGGRGKPTRYRFLFPPETTRNLDGSAEEIPRDPRAIPRDPRSNTARSTESSPITNGKERKERKPRSPIGESTGPPTLDLDAEPRRLSFRERGRLLAVEVFDQKRPRPAGEKAFTTAISVAAALLKAEHDERAIVAAMVNAPTISIATCEIELNRRRNGKQGRGDPNARSLMITRIANPDRLDERLREEEHR